MSEITKQDLMDFKTDIKDHISDKLDPIVEDINGHQVTLYGKDNRGGLVGDVNNIKNSGKIFKWVAGSGFIAGITGWINKFLH